MAIWIPGKGFGVRSKRESTSDSLVLRAGLCGDLHCHAARPRLYRKFRHRL